MIAKPLVAATVAGAATLAVPGLLVGGLIAKPVIAAALIKPAVTAATAGLVATVAAVASLPKPGFQVTIVEHQGPEPFVQPSPVPPPPVVIPTTTPTPVIPGPPIIPQGNEAEQFYYSYFKKSFSFLADCGTLEGFFCYRLPSGCYCPISTQV